MKAASSIAQRFFRANTTPNTGLHSVAGSCFHTSAGTLDFHKDFVLGTRSSAIRCLAMLLRASCDFELPGSIGDDNDEGLDPEIRAGIQEYLLAYAKTALGTAGIPAGSLRASEEMGFIAGLRNAYLAPDRPYIHLLDTIVRTVIEHGGTLNFGLEQIDFYQHFSCRAAIELERGARQPRYTFARYIREHTNGSRAGPQADGLTHASITGVELGALLEPTCRDRYRNLNTRFFRSDHTELDAFRLRELYEAAAAACSSAENLASLKSSGLFCESAGCAVRELQHHVHGQVDMLPPSAPLHTVKAARLAARSRFGMPSEGLPAIPEE